jgi:fatty acid desaturase
MSIDSVEAVAPADPIAAAAFVTSDAVDVPTIGLAIATYFGFGLLTWFHHALPWWIVAPLGGYIVALHGSLQHEAVHGFPFGRRWMTTSTVFPSLWLWLPYGIYRNSHLAHHWDDQLTCPVADPESNYVTPSMWAAMGPFHRRVRSLLTTLAGRLVLGPPYLMWRAGCRLLTALRESNEVQLRRWLIHLPSVAVVLFWVMAVCRIPLWQYLLLYVYPGLSLTLLRSFAEHRAAVSVRERIVTMQTNPVMALLFTNNHLHALHHAEPATAWHQRPARYRARKAELDAANGGYVVAGYRQFFRHYLFRAKEPPVHPLAGQGFPL